MLRHLDADLIARVRVYAVARGLRVPAAAAALLRTALDATEARQAGAAVVNARLTPEQRSEAGRRAVMARYAKR